MCLPIMTVNVEIKLNVCWAVKEPKSHCTYSDAQKAFMVEKFDIGKITGLKMDLYFASDEKRNTGKYKRDEVLSGQNLCPLFSHFIHI